MRILTKLIKKARSERNLVRWALLKILYYSRLGRFYVFQVRDMKLRLFSSAVCYEAFSRRGMYRSSDMLFLQNVLKPRDIVVDVGANVGFLTLSSAIRVGSSGKVIAIEPQPRIHGYLEEHVQLNALSNVRT